MLEISFSDKGLFSEFRLHYNGIYGTATCAASWAGSARDAAAHN